VVVGGMTVAPLVILVVLPALISLFSRRKMVADAPESAFEPAK
jgi:cobalt-zinc-cadmium resistance protein CzcA